MPQLVRDEFSDADYVLLQGGPNSTVEADNFRTFEQILGELNSNPKIIMPLDLETGNIEEAESIEDFDELIDYVKKNKEYDVSTYLERIDKSNSVEGNDFDYIFITPDTTFDEAKWAFKILGREEKVIFITADYHTPRTELILKFALNPSSYQVIGSEFTGSAYKELLFRVNEFYKRSIMKLFYIVY